MQHLSIIEQKITGCFEGFLVVMTAFTMDMAVL